MHIKIVCWLLRHCEVSYATIALNYMAPHLSIASSQPCWFNCPPCGSSCGDEAWDNTSLVFVMVQPHNKLVAALKDDNTLRT